MDYKKEMSRLLSDLKKKNHSRRKIERYLGYAEKTLDQVLSKGGNESIVNKLREYKSEVEKGNISAFETEPELTYSISQNPLKNKQGDQWSIIELLIQEIAIDRSRDQKRPFLDCYDELMSKVRSILNAGKNV
jgi:hypothetical protein